MRWLVLLGTILCAGGLKRAAADGVPYQFVRKIPIGGEGGWDILTIDWPARRLYLSHASKIIVVDLEKNPGMALDPPTDRIYLHSARFNLPPSPAPGATPVRPTVIPGTFKLLAYAPAKSPKS